jgi:nucleoside-triphosphatase
VGLDGSEGILSGVNFRGPHRVGRYGVDVEGFERFLDRLDLSSSPLVFVDEIGKMESLSPRFADLMRKLLDSGKTVVATIAMRGEGLIAEVKKRPDCSLVEVTPANRERLPGELAARLRDVV